MNLYPVPVAFGRHDQGRCGYCDRIVVAKTVEPIGWSIDVLGNRTVSAVVDIMSPCQHAFVRGLNGGETHDSTPRRQDLPAEHRRRYRDDGGRHVPTPP